jgi:hypothetical protein
VIRKPEEISMIYRVMAWIRVIRETIADAYELRAAMRRKHGFIAE